MFESLTNRFQALFSRIRSKGIVRKEDLASALREIRLALLEADVNYHVVKDLLSRVEKRAGLTESVRWPWWAQSLCQCLAFHQVLLMRQLFQLGLTTIIPILQ
ncbi:signal recognition particle receptor subunit alpha [Candidatus Hakubella thermalkaliphila]|uniref:signal recognition particle receptor subunit alpha n=1 Tax=Candidatus Hakubella thermalkaliphila TaxID=2754717 RepID=UPI0015936CEC